MEYISPNCYNCTLYWSSHNKNIQFSDASFKIIWLICATQATAWCCFFSFAKLCVFIDKLLLSVHVFSTAIITVFSIVITIVVISTYAQLSLYITKKLRNHKVNHIHCAKISLTYYIYFYIFLSSIDWKNTNKWTFI